MNGSLADKIQFWGFEEDVIVFQDGSTGFGLDLSSIDATTWDITRVNTLANSLDQFLNGLPSHIDLQFIQEIDSGNCLILDEHRNLASDCRNEDVKSLVETRLKRWEDRDLNGEVPFHGLKLFLRRPLRRLLGKSSGVFTKQESFVDIAEAEFESEIGETHRLKEDIIRSLEQLGIKPLALSQKEILNQIYAQWNPQRHRQIELGYYDPEYIVPGLIFSDALVSESGFSMGDRLFRIVSLKSFPDVTAAAMAQILQELSFGSKLFLSIHVPDQQKEYESLQSDRRMAFSLARGRRSGVSDLESEAKLQEIESLLASVIAQGEKVFDFSFQVLLCGNSEEDLELQVSATLAKVRELSGAEGMQETLAAFDIFSEMAVPNARSRERQKKIKTTNLSDFLPVFGPWRGHETASILLRSRLGSLVKFDPFSSELTNHNILISGGSGSGKSFCANVLLLQLLKENPKIYIVDIGNSYGRLCELMGGESLKLGMDMNLSLNPFDLLEGEVSPSGEKIKFLVSLIELMTKEDEATGLNKLEKALLEESILKCYELSNRPLLSDLKVLLLDHSEISLRRIGRILNAWTGDTAFGKFIDRPTNIELKKNLISFDLKGLDNVPDLQAVCLFLITDLVWREVQKDRGTKKILLFDECWQLLESEAGSQFIGNVFRTFRKYYAGVIAISQDIDDFARSKVANAILPNSGTKWILMQKGANQKRLAEVLQLNETESSLVASLYQERGQFSEAFLITGDYRSVVAVEPTPTEYWIATTDPRDIDQFEQLSTSQPDLSLSKVIESLSESMTFDMRPVKKQNNEVTVKYLKKMNALMIAAVLVFGFALASSASVFGEENAVLFKILEQSIRQYVELRKIMQNGNDSLGLLRDINRGINDSLYLMQTVKPNIDPGIYRNLENASDVLRKIESIYGRIQFSPDQAIQKEADTQVAEAIAMNNSIYEYTKKIDRIGEDVKNYSHRVSPGGAQKLTAQSIGVMLHVMNESLRAQATTLKLHAVGLSIQNKKDKEFTRNTLAVTESLRQSMQNQQSQFLIPRF